MTMRLTLQEMVAGAIQEATERTKLAMPEGEGAKAEGGTESKDKTCPKCENAKSDCTCPEKEKEGMGYKHASVATELVEKVASGVDFINRNFDQIDWTKVAQNVPEPMVGPGKNEQLATNMDSPPGPGKQSEQTGQATGQAQPEAAGSKDDAKQSDGQTNAETSLKTDMTQVPGGTGMQPQLEQPENLPVLKKASISRVRKLAAMRKQAADGESPAKITAGTTPLENPDASGSEDDVPKQPAPFEAQRKLVGSNESATNYTKGQAKAEPKKAMGEVLDEPAQKKSTDPVLQENLDAAGQAGVKISSVRAAAARSYLRKIAEAGEKPDATPEEKEKAKKLKEAIEAKKNGDKEKQSNLAMGYGGQASPSATMPVSSGAAGGL